MRNGFMKKVLFLVVITFLQSLFGGGDLALFKNAPGTHIAQKGLTREEASFRKALEIRCAKEEERSRELAESEAFWADQWEAVDALEAQAVAERFSRETAEDERITREHAEALQVQVIMEQATEDAFRTRKHLVVPEFAQEMLKRPRSIVRQGLFTEKEATPIQDRLIDLIGQEKKGICGAMYIFANRYIAQALIHQVAHKKINVTILVDSSFEKHRSKSCLRSLLENGVKVFVSPAGSGREKKIMHHKFLIFEDNESRPFFEGDESGALLWNGSYNLSFQANKNDENVEITNDPAPIGQFRRKLVELMLTSEPIVFNQTHGVPQPSVLGFSPTA